jgi:hypothetical protein
MNVEDLRYAIPAGKNWAGLFGVRTCSVCDIEVRAGFLARLSAPTVRIPEKDECIYRMEKDGELYMLCPPCYRKWAEQNQDVLVLLYPVAMELLR